MVIEFCLSVNSGKLNSGKINQTLLENAKCILLAEIEMCDLLRQAEGKLSGGVIDVYKYLKQRRTREIQIYLC